jgi:hypothetical protein
VDPEGGWHVDFGSPTEATLRAVKLQNGAQVVPAQGLVLDSRRAGYAVLPRRNMRTTSFTLFFEFKIAPGRAVRQILLGDWTHPWQLLVYITADGNVGTNLRKNINSHGSDPDQVSE